MSRLLRIAAREYAAYVRTVGFWLSICLMPVGILVSVGAPMLMDRTAPIPAVAILDLSGQGYGQGLGKSLTAQGLGGRPDAQLVPSPVQASSAPAAAVAFKPYLTGARVLPGGGRLDGAVILRPEKDATGASGVAADVWTRDTSGGRLAEQVRAALGDLERRARLVKAGIDPAVLDQVDAAAPQVEAYSPKAEGGKVGERELIQTFAGFGMGMLLWMVVFTGAGILLNSVIEEKSSRILEVLLTSASVLEVMGGKILGVAAVTATVLGVWLTIGASLLMRFQPEAFALLVQVLMSKGLLIYFAVYFVGGYLMYATLYTTVGAFCETTREAQTLLGPMMIFLMIPVVFMSQAITHPDAPILTILSWIPPFTPFLMAARAASGPPWWQILGTGALMAAMTAAELWVAGRAFRAGALSNVRFEPKRLLASLWRPQV